VLLLTTLASQVRGQTLEELKAILAESMADEDYGRAWEAYRMMGIRYVDQTKYDSAKINYDLMMAHSKEYFSDTLQIRLTAKVYKEMAILYNRQSDFDKALLYSDSAIQFFDQIGLAYEVALTRINIGVYKTNQGKIEEAIAIYEDLLDYSLSLEDTAQINYISEFAYTNIGKVYIDQRDWRRAVQYTQKALLIATDEIGRGISHLNLSNAYMQLKSYDTALYHGQMADTIFAPMNNPLYEYSVDVNLAEVHNKLGNYELELELVDQVEKISAQYDEVPGLYFATNARGRTLSQLGRLNEGIKNLKRAEGYARQLDNKTYLRATLQNMAEAYARKGQFKQAYQYHEEFYQLDSSLLIAEKTEALNEILTRYESEKKDRELAEQTLELTEQEAEIDAKAAENQVLQIILVAVVLFGLLFYSLYRSRKREELQVALIQEQEKGLEAVFEATEEERKRIAKDLHGHLYTYPSPRD